MQRLVQLALDLWGPSPPRQAPALRTEAPPGEGRASVPANRPPAAPTSSPLENAGGAAEPPSAARIVPRPLTGLMGMLRSIGAPPHPPVEESDSWSKRPPVSEKQGDTAIDFIADPNPDPPLSRPVARARKPRSPSRPTAPGTGAAPGASPSPAAPTPPATGAARPAGPAPGPVPDALRVPDAGASLGLLTAPVAFRHPQANRELALGAALVAFHLQRAKRRTIGFTVGPDGLSVRAPSWVTLGAIDAALREKADWIVAKLQQARERQAQVEGGRILWRDGVIFPYLGAPLQVVLDPRHGFSGTGGSLVELPQARYGPPETTDAAPPPGVTRAPASEPPQPQPQRQLWIGLSRSATPAQIRDAVQAWLMRDARRHFTARLDHYAPLLGVRWSRLRLSSAQTRWGSAKADGSIRLNWRLLHYRPALIDYVVAHELAHLRVMDHSPRFWDTVATVVPDYAALRRGLHDQPAPLWD